MGGVDGNQAATDELKVLTNSRPLADDDGRIARPIAASRSDIVGHGSGPDDLPGSLVESRDHGVQGTGCADQMVAIDEGLLAVPPARHHLSTEVFAKILPPNLTSRRQFGTQ